MTVLSSNQITRLHDASLQILRTTGVRVPHAEMRALFAQADAQVDDTSHVVRIPEDLVVRSLGSAGKTFTLYGRDRALKAEFGVGSRNYNSIAGEALWLDDACTTRRYALL